MRFVEYISQYVSELETGTRCKRRHAVPVTKNTLTGYETLRGVMKRFEADTGRQYEIEEIGMEFQRAFAGWCYGRKLKSNTLRQYLTLVRVVMNSAVREHLCSNTEFRMAEFIPLEVETEMMVLSPEMIARLMGHRFSDERLARARDLFVVGYLTGQRFSDYSRICMEMYAEIAGKRFVRVVQRKTGCEVYVPLDSRVDETLRRYGGKLPKMSLKEFNKRLREVSEELGWERMGKMTSHTARRSFATNAYAAGISMASIMCITGHTREEHLRKYLRLKAELTAVQAARDLIG